MTIAACCLCSEGVVLGADSTATRILNGVPHFFDFNQKIFEIGLDGTLGIVTWGLASLQGTSHRTMIAELDDDLRANPPTSVAQVAQRWSDRFFARWFAQFGPQFVAVAQALEAKGQQRTPQETQQLQNMVQASACGFCIGGYWLPDRTPCAFVMEFDPRRGKQPPNQLGIDTYFFAMRNPVLRMIKGYDERLLGDIMASGKWTGTPDELKAVLDRYWHSAGADLPLRDAIDFVHCGIFTTIKAHKFSQVPQMCGGPIEIAVISTDRRFRWVRHKQMDEAIVLQEGRA